jgi:hypothetical protein
MSERTRARPIGELGGAPGGILGDVFEGAGEPAGLVAVTHGVFAERLPLAGRTVAEIRRLYGDRFDIPPDAGARLDQRPVDDDAVVEAGQVLEFARPGGEKGASVKSTPGDEAAEATVDLLQHALAFGAPRGRRRRRRAEPPGAGYTVAVEGAEVRATSPEGKVSARPLDQVLERLRPPAHDSGGVLPDGVKAVLPMPGGEVLVHQTPPRVHAFRWIARESKAPFGPPSQYRTVRLALPYVIVLAVYRRKGAHLELLGRNEAFFANAPLRSLEDELSYPCLLNLSRFDPPEDKPLAWICTQHLDLERAQGIEDQDRRRTACLHLLLEHLFETGFNLSSDVHEAASWFSETVNAKVDPRLESVEAWECATREDPAFPLEVKWLPTGFTLRQVAERIRKLHFADEPLTALDVARAVVDGGGGG